jgi:hypothetical protein
MAPWTGYTKPCVLDLKMGTRMYGDFATEKKRRSQVEFLKWSTLETVNFTSEMPAKRICVELQKASYRVSRVTNLIGLRKRPILLNSLSYSVNW